MKNTFKFISIIICIIFTIAVCQPISVLADADSKDALVQSKVMQMNNKVSNLNSLAPVTVSTYTQLKTAIDNECQNIILSADIQLEDTLQIGYNIYIHSPETKRTILSPANLRHINVLSENVVLAFDNVILNGNCTKKRDISGGIEASYKNLDIFGVDIQKCNADSGSAIENFPENDMGTFALYNCTFNDNLGYDTIFNSALDILIYNCSTENNKGDICLGPSDEIYHSDIIVYNSVFKNNSAYDGAGLNIYWSDAYLNENTIIENNTADNGGGIYVFESSLENHAVIKNNTADKGGGIYSENSEVINYADIKNNTSNDNGGGVNLDESTFELKSGEISYNKAGLNSYTNANYSGGGICIQKASGENDVVINGGMIKNNISAVGAGIGYLYSDSFNQTKIPKIIVKNGSISNNGYLVNENGEITSISNEGGGIFGSYVEISGGSIENNIARYGAGIKTIDLTMTGGIIKNNGYYTDSSNNEILLNYWGGGIYTYGNTLITGGTISANQAERGAGLYIVKNLTLNSNAKVENNKAHDVGGGVYFYHLVDNSNTDKSKLINNTALKDGDQYYVF